MEGTYKKQRGNAGLDGVQFQMDLVIVFILNALHTCRNWRISTENEQAGKFDDLVLELPDKNVFVQAKSKQTKTISREQLFSNNSKNADFSLAKYFFSFLEIRSENKETRAILCTNTDIKQKGLENVFTSHDVGPDSLLHYDGTTCSYFTLNENILPDLKQSAESYPVKNSQREPFDKATITDENMKCFLKDFKIFYKYPSGKELQKVIEGLLRRLDNLWRGITYREIYQKAEEWFKQEKGTYLTTAGVHAMLCEIRSQKYCNSLEEYNVSFERNDFDFSNSNRIIHINTDGANLLQMVRTFQAIPGDKAKQLYVNPGENIEMQKRMVAAFGFPQYIFLIMIWPKIKHEPVKLEITSQLREILGKNRYKKIVLLTEGDVDVAGLVGLTDISSVECSINFQDFSKHSQNLLLKNDNLLFQGERVSLEEILEAQAFEYVKSLDSRHLEKLVLGKEIKIGEPLLDLDEDVARYYVHRTFEKETHNQRERGNAISEENLIDVTENVVLISDSPGMGKTTALIKMAAHIKEKYSRMWVIKMNLIDYSKILQESLVKGRETLTIKELMNSQETTKFKNQFEEFLFSIQEKVILMFDGVDEITPTYASLIVDLLRRCQESTNIAKVFATTRPHMTEELKKVLDVRPYKMLPFTRDNQTDYLKNYWTHNLQLEDPDDKRKCAQYAKILINKMLFWIRPKYFYEENSIGLIPLHVKMIAEIFQEKNTWESNDWESCSEFLNGTEKERKLPEKFDLKKLYDIFINKKRNVFIEKENPCGLALSQDLLKREFDDCLAHHRNLALKVVLVENDCNLFSTNQEVDSSRLLKIGIVLRNADNVSFMHRTFAEYFVSESILQELHRDTSLEFQKFLIDKILVKREFRIVRNFLDNRLQNVVDSLPCIIFSKYQSHACKVNINFIFQITKEGHVAILQLFFRSIKFKIIGGKVVDTADVRIDSEETLMNTLSYLRIITREGGVNIINEVGDTPLINAVESGNWDMVSFLIDHGADVNMAGVNGMTPLLVICATNYGLNSDVLKPLVERGANANVQDEDRHIALHWAARGNLEAIKYIVECGGNVNDRDKDDQTALHWAVEGSNLEVIKYIVKCGGNVNDRDGDGCTVLHRATTRYYNLETIKYIVECGGNVNDRDRRGCTVLHWAIAGYYNLEAIKYIVECGGNVNDRNRSGCTVLHWASRRGELEAIEYIITCGGNVNDRDGSGRSALHWAVEGGNLEAIKYIVEKGANINNINSNGQTAAELARAMNNFDIVNYLETFHKS